MIIGDRPFTQDVSSLLALYHWIFDDLNQAKVALGEQSHYMHLRFMIS